MRSVVPFAALLLLLSSVATFGDVSFFMYVEGTSDQGMDMKTRWLDPIPPGEILII